MSESYYKLVEFGLKPTEANIQGEFYHQCRMRGLNCALEFYTPVGRLDVVIFDDALESIIAIVECKNCKPLNRGGAQVKKYSKIGVSIFDLILMKDCESLALKIHRMLITGELLGVPLSEVLSMERHRRRTKIQRLSFEWDESLIIRE